MRAAVCHEFGSPLQIEEIDLDPPGPGEVQIGIRACGICHSDIHYADGAWGGKLPIILGHEAAGVVEAVGPGVTTFAPGDRVVAGLIRYCGSCFHCGRQEPFLCEGRFPLDQEHRLHLGDSEQTLHQGLRTGAFAESTVVDQSQVVALPDGVPYASAALVTCAVLTGWGAVVHTGNVGVGDSVGVIGAGGVGINSIQAAAMAGATPVVALDFSDDKLSMARTFGATETVNPQADDARTAIEGVTEGRGLDCVFVTVGSSRAILQGLALLRAGGTLVVVGMPGDDDLIQMQIGDLAGANQRILGSKMGSCSPADDIPTLLALYRDGRLKLDELVSGCYPLERINEAMDEVRQGTALRNVITFEPERPITS